MPGDKPIKEEPWLFSEVIGDNISKEEEDGIFQQLQDMKQAFDNPKDFVANVLERAKLTEDVEKKLLLVATAGKMVGFFSG
jgi:hypothetical protein